MTPSPFACRVITAIVLLTLPSTLPAASASNATVVAPEDAAAARRLPPAGIEISASDRAELTAAVVALRRKIDAATREIATKDPGLQLLLPDVEIFHKAVDWALRYDEFFDPKQVDIARHLIDEGVNRAEELAKGKAPWTTATGRVIRGYKSKIDDSVQPFALVIPTNWRPNQVSPRRLDVVLAGRGEKRSELAFIAEHQASSGEIVPANGI